MTPPLTIACAVEFAIANGGVCLSDTYKNTKDKLFWRCSVGHEWAASFGNIRSGSWCPTCRLGKYETKDLHKFAFDMGGKYLGGKYRNQAKRVNWECGSGHKWSASWGDIKSLKNWCRECRCVGVNDADILAKEKNGKCLTRNFTGTSSVIDWECADGHKWSSAYKNISSGHWCPYCSGVAKKTLQDALNMALDRGGKCLSDKYININSIMDWQCDCGNKWSESFNNAKSGIWCEDCRRSEKLSVAQNHAIKNYGRCISSIYIGTKNSLIWECRFGHRWKANFDNVINNDTWCSLCSISKPQLLIGDIIEDLFNTIIIHNYRGFSWLKNKKTKMPLEIDIWAPEIKLAIEYDGEQHFMPLKFSSISDDKAMENLKYIRANDRRKDKIIKKNNTDVNYFIRFNYKEKNMIDKEYILNKLINNGISIGDIK